MTWLSKTACIAVILLAAGSASALDFDAYTYWVEPNTVKEFDWAPVQDAEGYEIYVYCLERSKSYLVGRTVTYPTHKIRFQTPGHYVLYARAFVTRDGTRVWGEWKNSLEADCGIVNGQPRPWVIYVPYSPRF